jgi:surfeit locus 1 family protein
VRGRRLFAALAPRFLPVHLLALVLVASAGWLGSWQFSAWQADRAYQSLSVANEPPVPLAQVFGPDDPFPGLDNGRPVTVAGVWLADSTFLVSGRERGDAAGTVGFWVVTPLAVGGAEGAALPVVLGWIGDPAERPAPPTGDAQLVGWLQLPEGAASQPDLNPGDDVVPTLRIAEVVQRLDRDAYGGFVIAQDPVVIGAEVEPVEFSQSTVADWSAGARNLFYAAEWWFFGGFAVFVWWRYVRDELTEEAPGLD